MKKFPLDKRYEIKGSDGESYYIDGDEYVRHSDSGQPAYRFEDDEVYTYGQPTKIIGYLEGRKVVSKSGETILKFDN
ncbi:MULTISPECIES: hypothetical protein [Pantoea]|uniref:hypothetical protein n=1 Tax=Pantoea TaxID=53335 RepID=UPI00257D7B97|nr:MULTISPECIES: hypothetical protein [Pantoea]